MANERDHDTDDLNRDSHEYGGSSGDAGRTSEGTPSERMGGRSEENMRGTGEGSDEDEFEETDDMEDEEEDTEEGTI